MSYFDDVNDTDFRKVLQTDDDTKRRVASQLAHRHTDQELAEILASNTDPAMREYIRAAAARLGRRVCATPSDQAP